MIPNFIRIDNQTYFADIQIGMNKVLIRYTYNISSEGEDLQQACNRMVALLQAKLLIPKPEVKRTVFQNALYWKWMEVVSEITGNNKDAIHALMKMRFLSKRKLVKIGGKRNYVNIEWSTKKLSVKGFTKYLNDIYQFFAERELVLPTEDKLDMDSLIILIENNMETHEAIVASMQESKLKIVNDIIKNANDNFIDVIFGLNDLYFVEGDKNILLKIKFEGDDISPYQVIYLDKLTKKYLKGDDCNWYCMIKGQYFYITFEFYDDEK